MNFSGMQTNCRENELNDSETFEMFEIQMKCEPNSQRLLIAVAGARKYF